MIDLSTNADAKARGWGLGWPHDNKANIIPITWSNGVQPVGGVHHAIATLVTALGDETIRRGYHPHEGWCWGFEDRAIAGTSVPSNHSWGLAVDINAPTNPYTRPLHTDMPAWMPALWGQYGFRWGGHYAGPFDAMHYEFMGTPAQAVAMTAAVAALNHPHLQEDDMDVLFTNAKGIDGQPPNALWEPFPPGRRHIDSPEYHARAGTVKIEALDPSAAFWHLPAIGA